MVVILRPLCSLFIAFGFLHPENVFRLKNKIIAIICENDHDEQNV